MYVLQPFLNRFVHHLIVQVLIPILLIIHLTKQVLYVFVSRLSDVEDLGKGVIKPIFHIFGILSSIKHLLNKAHNLIMFGECFYFLKLPLEFHRFPQHFVFAFIHFNADSISVTCIVSCKYTVILVILINIHWSRYNIELI